MPQIGGVYVPDDLLPAAERPSLGSILGAAAEGAWGQVRYGLPYQYKTLTGELEQGDEQYYTQKLAEANAASSRAAPASVDELLGGRVNPVRFAIENLTASLPYMVGGAAGAVGGGLVGGVPGAVGGAVLGGVPQFSASNTARAVEEQGGLSEAAAVKALAVAPVQSAADAAIGRFLPGVGKSLGPLAPTLTGGLLRRTATSIGKAGVTEALTEAGQQVAERYAAGIPLSSADAAGEYVDAAVAAFAVGGLLGAGGGIRRTPAVSKPAAEVTEADMGEYIAKVLMLPAPADFIGTPGGGVSINPAGTQQLALPSPEMFPQTDMLVDAAGRAAPADVLPEVLANTPRSPDMRAGGPEFDTGTEPGVIDFEDPAIQELLRQAVPPRAAPLEASTILQRGLQELPAPVSVEVPQGRPFAQEPIEDLQTVLSEARKGKAVDPALLEQVEREVAARTGEATGAAPLTADDFQQRVDEMKQGLRGGFVQNVTAASPEELLTKVYEQVFTNADTRSNTVKFAQRLGILDENLEPGPEAKKLEARAQGGGLGDDSSVTPPEGGSQEISSGSPAPPPTITQSTADDPTLAAEFQRSPRWMELKPGQMEAQVRALNPTSEEDLTVKVFKALGATREETGDAGVSPQIEMMARKLGLVTDDGAMDITPKGRRTFLSTPDGFEETVIASQQQGYDGKQASVFDRGVRAYLSGTDEQFGSPEDAAAYQVGKVWAENFVLTGKLDPRQKRAPITAQETRELLAEDGRGLMEISPGQIQQQASNRLIDTADLSGAQSAEIAELFRLARAGVDPVEVGRAIERVQSGKSLFTQPEADPSFVENYAGTKVVRGQPQFREMNTPDRGPTRAQQRQQTADAIEAKRAALREEIDGAFATQDITPVERLQLVSRLMRNDFRGVADRLPGGPLRNDMNVSRRGFLAGVAASAVTAQLDAAQAKVGVLARTAPTKQLEAYLKSGNVVATLKHLAEHSADNDYRVLARKMLSAGGWERVTLTTGADQGSLLGITTLQDDGSSAIELYGDKGLYEETVLHELLHAYVQQRWAALSVYNERNERILKAQGDRRDQVVRDFVKLWDAVGMALKLTNPELVANEAWASNFYGDPDEALAWVMTNKQAQAYLRSVDETGAKVSDGSSLWSRFVEWVAKLLGTTSRQASALERLLDAGHAILDAGKDVRTNDFSKAFAEGLARQQGRKEMRVGAAERTVEATNELTKQVAAVVARAVENVNTGDFGVKAQRMLMGWMSHLQLNRAYGAQVPSVPRHSDAHARRTAIHGRISHIGVSAMRNFEQLEQADRGAADRVVELMALTTEHQLDPTKKFEQHTHLGWVAEKDGTYSIKEGHEAEIDRLRPVYGRAVKLKNDLSRGDGAGIRMFNEFRALNEANNYMRMASDLYSAIANDRELSLGVPTGVVNPADTFMESTATDAESIKALWEAELDTQVTAVTEFIREKMGQVVTESEGSQQAMRQHLDPIAEKLGLVMQAKAAMRHAPYFHLARFGEHFGSAVIAKTPEGVVDPKAQKIVTQALQEAGLDEVQISADNTNPRIMARFETKEQADRFAELMRDLQQKEVLTTDPIRVGPRSQKDNFGVLDGVSAFVRKQISDIENSAQFTPSENATPAERAELEVRKEQAIQMVRDSWIEYQPDNSISKVLVRRKTIPGYAKDMTRSWAHRWQVGATHIANTVTAPEFNKLFADMQAQYEDELVVNRLDKDGNPIPRGDPYTVLALKNELQRRDARTPVNEAVTGFDKARATAHAYFLGLSPAHAALQLIQVGTTSLPELAKKHGFANSFHALRRASGPALAVVKAVLAESSKAGWKHYGDLTITEDALVRSGVSEQDRKFITAMIAEGALDIGSMARALGQIAERGDGNKLDIGLKYASAMGLYAETYSRLVTALAAKDLHGTQPGAEKYAKSVVDEALYDYQATNVARQLGRKGILGPITPMVTQFMSWSIFTTEKLFSEFHGAVAKARPGESAEAAAQRRAESQRFLVGHLTAMTALAGSLGLPFATVFASVLERIVDGLDDDEEPFDATAAWRNFLADVLGKDMAEIAARGLPRALGVDLSQRAGEQNLLPFSEFIADRRPWKESVASLLDDKIGAVPSMVSNIITGGGKIADGDLLGGMKEMMPVGVKSPLEAYRMTETGYVDTKGNKLPLSPGASDILWQLIGFAPAEKAEYQEARTDQQARRGEISRRATVLRQQISKAWAAGDQDALRDVISEAMSFDQDNPAFAVLPGIEASLQRQMQARQRAVALKTPVGVSLKDIAGQGLTQYANVGYAN